MWQRARAYMRSILGQMSGTYLPAKTICNSTILRLRITRNSFFSRSWNEIACFSLLFFFTWIMQFKRLKKATLLLSVFDTDASFLLIGYDVRNLMSWPQSVVIYRLVKVLIREWLISCQGPILSPWMFHRYFDG